MPEPLRKRTFREFDDQDGIDIEKLRVEPAFMQRVLEQQARSKSKRKEWQRFCTVIPRGWELRLLEAKREVIPTTLSGHRAVSLRRARADGRYMIIPGTI